MRDVAAMVELRSVMGEVMMCECAIFLGHAAKDMDMMTYVIVHRNPLVT